MKHKIIPIMAAMVLGLCFFALPAQAKYGGGTGEPNDPYLIYTAEQMNAIGADSNDWDKNFLLCADIDLSGYIGAEFNIIGNRDNRFTGTFDGNGHAISNFSYTSTDTDYVGLFGYVRAENAEIKNLGLIEPEVDAGTSNYVGSLVGWLHHGTITNCCVAGGSVAGNYHVGGLVGLNRRTINNCYSTGSVTGNSRVGGLVGDNYGGTITNCYSKGDVSGYSSVGGLVGYNRYGKITHCYSTGSASGGIRVGGLVGENSGTITNCYSKGDVSGYSSVGGLVGCNYENITHCYSTGSASGGIRVGGLVGYNYESEVTNSFWDIETSGQSSSDGGTGKITAQMKDPNTYIGWGCGLVWTINAGVDYPRLVWENMPGEFITVPSDLYGGGAGDPNDPYLIYTAEQLNMIGLFLCNLDKHFKLMADIDLSGYTGPGPWPPPPPPPWPSPLIADIDLSDYSGTAFNIIGTRYNPFTGVFDGNGHTISNFTYTSTSRNYIGLFGYVLGGESKDMGLIDPNVDAGTGEYVGSLVAYLVNGAISNCYVEGGSVAGNYHVGGLVGRNSFSGSPPGVPGFPSSGCTISNCYATASVSGSFRVGGLVGENYRGTITNCYSTGSVSGNDYVGGLAGSNYGTISNCYATGSVTGTSNYISGLAGSNRNGTISNCYATGSITDTSNYIGGLAGYNRNGTISNCYSAGSVSGNDYVGGLVGYDYSGVYTSSFWDNTVNPLLTGIGNAVDPNVIGESTANMQTESTFTDAGWDFENIWWMLEGTGYPRLRWEAYGYGGGSGTAEDPYLIYTAEQMNTIGACQRDWDKHFRLMADIDLDSYTVTSFNIIGYYRSWNDNKPFTGVFDGNDKKIANFTYTSTGTSCIGFFGYIDDPNAEVKNLGLIDPNVNAGTGDYIGSLVGYLAEGTLTSCYADGGGVSGPSRVGGLVGWNRYGTITNCYSTGDVSGNTTIGGLVGWNYSTITNCYATGDVSGENKVGGLVGVNDEGGKITNCYSTGDVSGNTTIGGMVGWNYGTITNCYATGDVSGENKVGGLVGQNGWYYCDWRDCWWKPGTITNCYSASSVTGTEAVGGLVGQNTWCDGWDCYEGEVWASFWDIETSGQTTSDGGTGLPTEDMQKQITFTDAGWDFNTPVWTIDEGVDYPRLWWELVPVLHAEPEVTLGTSNTIWWEPVVGAVEYYAECAEDVNFTSIIYNSGWITETSYEFTGLELGQRYWYSVKARNAADVESQWSNVESSLQCTLADAVDMMLDPESLKNKNMKSALLNKIDEVLEMIDDGLYEDALDKLRNDILEKMNGCDETGQPDKNDWIITCEGQSQLCPLVLETIENVKGLMNQ